MERAGGRERAVRERIIFMLSLISRGETCPADWSQVRVLYWVWPASHRQLLETGITISVFTFSHNHHSRLYWRLSSLDLRAVIQPNGAPHFHSRKIWSWSSHELIFILYLNPECIASCEQSRLKALTGRMKHLSLDLNLTLQISDEWLCAFKEESSDTRSIKGRM